MKKISVLVLLVMVMFVFSPAVLAKNEVAVQNQDQVKTQNEGEDQGPLVQITEQKDASGSTKSAAPRSETALQRMSSVATFVESLLTTRTLKGGIGDQVRVVAQEQKNSQDEVQAEVLKVEGRGKFLKTLIGSNYKALKNIEKQIGQNELRIKQLTGLKNKLIDSGDITMVQKTIEALTQQNISLQEMINVENQTKSMFGWLFRSFVK